MAVAGPDKFFIFAEKFGVPDIALVTWKLCSDEPMPVERLRYKQSPETKLIMAVRLPERDTSLLAALRNGEFDACIQNMARRVAAADTPIRIRFAYEFNDGTYPWGAYYPSLNRDTVPLHRHNNPEDFKPAFRHFVKLFGETFDSETKQRDSWRDLVTMDLSFNRRSAGNRGTSDFKSLYPGNDVVDITTVASYNRCGTGRFWTTVKSFAEEFKPAYDEIVSFVDPDMPIGVAETATAPPDLGCDYVVLGWYSALLDSLIYQFPRVREVTFGFKVVGEGTATNEVDFSWIPEDQENFKALIDGFMQRPHPGVPSRKP